MSGDGEATGVPPLPQPGGLPPRRRLLGLGLAAVVLSVQTPVLVALRGTLSLASVLLLYLLTVVASCVVGGLVPGLACAVVAFLLANYLLTPPFHTLSVEGTDRVIALLVFLVVAGTVSLLVDLSARRRAAAARQHAERLLLGRLATEPLAARAEDVLADVASVFGLTSVALVGDAGPDDVLAGVGRPFAGPGTVQVPAGAGRTLRGEGPELFAEDRRLLHELAQAASRAVDAERMAEEARRARALVEVDRLRSALLASVGHDLRTPLTGIKAAAATLRAEGRQLDPDDQDQLLAAIEGSADGLSALVANLLDLSRLRSGALQADLRPVVVDEVVARSLTDGGHGEVDNQVPDDLPMVPADAGLLERVVANLVDNARRHTPSGATVTVVGRESRERVEVSVVDHGPGVPAADWPRMFVPFQRLDDRGGGASASGWRSRTASPTPWGPRSPPRPRPAEGSP